MKRRQSQKGSVLLSVVCFTTVLTILATTALSMSHVADKTSNKNVRCTQAEITAENYLQQYLSTFGGVYDDLNTLAAGTTEAAPREITVTMNKGPGTNAQKSQGDCKIYVYKKGSGVYVKSVATYAGEEEASVAYFNGTVATPYESNSTIETFGGVSGGANGLGYSGDLLLEGDPTDTVTLHNTQSVIKGNVYTNSNMLFSDTTNTKLQDTNEGTAPTLAVGGYLFLNQCEMTTSVGKRDGAGNLPTDSGYDVSVNGLGNKDGYILCDKKVVFGMETKIGDSSNPIDVYSYGAYFGSVPTSMGDYSAISSISDSYFNDNGSSSPFVNGNLYCYKGTNATTQDGSVYVGKNGSGASVNGDVIIQGDLYITNGSKFTVNGNLYCTGNIYYGYESVTCWWPKESSFVITNTAVIKSDGTLSDEKVKNDGKLVVTGSMINSTPSDARSVMPALDYDPSKYDPVTSPNPTRSSPSIYQNRTVNNMFADKYQSIDTEYSDAYAKSGLSYTYIDEACTTSMQDKIDEMTAAGSDGNAIKNYIKTNCKKLYINSNYRFDLTALSPWYDNMAENEYVIKMPASGDDLFVLLPSNNNQFKVMVDFSDSPTKNVSTNNMYSSVPKNFCYFMLDCGSSATNYADAAPAESNWDFYKCKITDQNHTNPATDFNSTKDKANNIFLLAPDNCKINLKSENGSEGIQAVVYSPKSELILDGPATTMPLFGQGLVGSLNQAQNDTQVGRLLPSPDSILGYINIGAAATNLEFNYFTNKIA